LNTTNVIIFLAKCGNINAYLSDRGGGGGGGGVGVGVGRGSESRVFFFNPILNHLLLFITKTKFNSLSSLKDLAFPLLQQGMWKAPIYWHILLLQAVSECFP